MSKALGFGRQSMGFGLMLLMSHTVYADISGTVFRDFNADGVLTTGDGFNETGQAGVTVKAFDVAGAEKASAISAADGGYTLAGLNSGADYRVEFSWTETGLMPSAAGGTSVQFVKDGATNINFAVLNPNDYSHTSNPYLVIPQYINGNPLASSGIGGKTGLYAFPYKATSVDSLTQTPAPTTKATVEQIGATWGTAFQRSTKTLYAAAVLRRYAGFGPLGIGGIYKIDMSDPTAASTGSLSYVDVKSIGIPVGDEPRDGGACNSLATRIDQPAHDIAAALQVGSVGIGGISMDNDHSRLWLVNMADRKLYGIQHVSPTTTPTTADVLGGYSVELPAGLSCQSGGLRPWAVKYHQGKVYVGAVCDAINAYPGTEELAGYVLRFDPNNTTAGFAVEHTFRFNTPRANYGSSINTSWYGWQNYITTFPLLASIEFDLDGSLMVGILDRASMMSGANNYNSLDCANTDLSNVTGAGDVLRFCNVGGSYINGGSTGCTTTIPKAVKAHTEYYWGDYGPLKNQKTEFNETAQGGLAFLPGSGQIVSNGFDMVGFDEGGIYWFNNQTGADDNRYFIYTTQTGIAYTPETMGKVAGLGDLEAILYAAPIEIGNRIWLDTDKDGTQDAGENGIPNVQVQLLAGTTVVATATTDSDGTYYFSSATGTNTSSKQYGLSLQPNTAYTVKFPTTVNVTGTAYTLTTASAGGDTLLDSNAASSGEVSISTTDIPMSGANNHSFDVGYVENPQTDLALSKTVTKTTVKKGETVQYVLTVSNTGAGAASAVEVKDSLPAGVSYQSHVASQGSYSDSTGIWTVGTLNNGESATLTIDVQVK